MWYAKTMFMYSDKAAQKRQRCFVCKTSSFRCQTADIVYAVKFSGFVLVYLPKCLLCFVFYLPWEIYIVFGKLFLELKSK